MKTLLILAHPNFKDSKINKTLIESIKSDSHITIHNICEKYPDLKIDAEKEIKLLAEHDRIVFEFPLFWFSSPSFLKEWEDVVFSAVLYGSNPKLLEGKKLQIITTTGSPEEKYRANGRNQKNLEELLSSLSLSGAYLKMEVKPVFAVYNAMAITEEELNKAIKSYKEILA